MTTRAGGDPGRADLARQWAGALRTTAYVPTSRHEIEHLLGELLDGLFDTLTAIEFSPDTGRAVGQQLVVAGFTGEQSLSHTVEVLGPRLPADPELQGVDGLAGKITSLVGAVAAGYAAALRTRTLDQQEEVKQALLKATRDAERGLTGQRSQVPAAAHVLGSGDRDQRPRWHAAGGQPGIGQDPG